MIFSTSSIKKVYFGLITIISLFGNNLHSSEKGFITCRPCGGGRLGNQMFSIAATLSIAIDENINAYFPYLNQVRNADTPMNKEKIFWRLNNSFPPKSPKHTIIGVGDNKKKNNLRMKGKFKDGVCSRLQCWSENHFIHTPFQPRSAQKD